jgi:ferredoxin
MRVVIDGASCMGHGRCYRVAPDLITYDDEGYPVLRDAPIDVPAGQEGAADEAVGTCPEEAISLLED